MPRLTLLATAAVAALAAPASALAAWTPPTVIDTKIDMNPAAQGALGGSVLTGWLSPAVSLSKRSGSAFTPLAPISATDPFEKAWAAALDADGNPVVLTVRRHKPVQRIRARVGNGAAARTISDNTHSATAPKLAVAHDGTAVAAWLWHDPAGWRVQAAIRRPGQPRFERPQNVSPPAPRIGRAQPRPWLNVAAGEGGRAAVTWQVGGSSDIPEQPLHLLTAGPDGVFGADQAFTGAGQLADVDLAFGRDGALELAWLDQNYGRRGSSLHVSQGTAGAPLPPAAVLSAGGKGTSSGGQVVAAFSADGAATVAWAKPGDRYEDGGALEVFTRAPGGAFGAAQTLAQHAEGLSLAGGPGASAALVWMVDHRIHAATRSAAGGPFGADTMISNASVNGLWPTVAMTAAGDAVAAWVTNTDGSGGGQPTVAVSAP